MFDGLRAPFTQRVDAGSPVLRTGGWLLKLGGLLAILVGVTMAAVVLMMVPAMVMVPPAGGWRATMVLVSAMQFAVTLGLGLLMASMFGTTLLHWEARDPKARTYALVLGWFLALTGALGLWQALTGPIPLGLPIVAPQAVQTALAMALLWAAYHPQTRAAMSPSQMPPLPSR